MRPPSTRNVAAFTYDDSSLARKSAAFTISRGFARRPIGQWIAPPLERLGIVTEDVEQERRLDGAWAERVHAHALTGELHPQLPRQREHRALRGRIGDLRRGGAEDGDEARDVDHRAAAPLQQVRDPVLAAEEDAARVDGLHAIPRLGRGVQDRRVVVGRDPGVVVEDVDAAEALRRRVHHRLDVGLLRHVRLEREGVAGAESDRLLRGLQVHVGGAHLGALLGEEDRRLAAHAAAGTGDHADLSIQALHQPSVERNTFLTSE